jgi:hypothetical protein
MSSTHGYPLRMSILALPPSSNEIQIQGRDATPSRGLFKRARSTWPSFSSLAADSCRSSPLLRLSFPSLRSHRTPKTYPEQTETQLTIGHCRLAPNPCVTIKPRHQCVRIHCSPRCDAPPIIDVSTFVGTIWSRWESAALWSSPAHPVQLACSLPVSRPSQNAPGALLRLCIHHSDFLEYSTTIAPASQRGHTWLNFAIADRAINKEHRDYDSHPGDVYFRFAT